MMARCSIERAEACRKAPAPEIASLVGSASIHYCATGSSSTEYEARIIAAQCRLSSAVARRVIELIGLRGGA